MWRPTDGQQWRRRSKAARRLWGWHLDRTCYLLREEWCYEDMIKWYRIHARSVIILLPRPSAGNRVTIDYHSVRSIRRLTDDRIRWWSAAGIKTLADWSSDRHQNSNPDVVRKWDYWKPPRLAQLRLVLRRSKTYDNDSEHTTQIHLSISNRIPIITS